MLVQLLSHTPNPTAIVAAAAKLCYSDSTITNLLDQSTDKQEAMIAKVIGLGHFSVLEHVSFSFGIEGISRACSHQLVRHRLASFSQQSQRYVNANAFKYVTPPSITENEHQAIKLYDDTVNTIREAYVNLLALGVPQEDARYLLPNAAGTSLTMTMNARELHHFFTLRCCNRAQWEIRKMAEQMLQICYTTAPALFASAGPSCLRTGCSEGKMTCGMAKEVKEDYEHLKSN